MPSTPQDLIARLGDLPPLPQVATQVLRLAGDPDASAEDLRRVISIDPALTGQILKVANSALFGMMREVVTLTQAILTLGFTTIRSVVIASSAKTLYQRGGPDLQTRLLWEHALAAALASRALAARSRRVDLEEAFIGGLLHDIGKSVLALRAPERYGALVRTIYNERGASLELELEVFGFDHAMVGEALLDRWHLAGGLRAAARWHHDPLQAPDAHRPLVALVALANQVALERAPGLGDPQSLHGSTAQAQSILGLDDAALSDLQAGVRATLAQEQAMIAAF